jgi:hypothetical protein
VTSAVQIELPSRPGFNAVGRLVTGGYASRLELPVERIEDLQLAVEALLSRSAAGGALIVRMSECERGLDVTLGPFAPAPEERRSVERMLHALVEDVLVQDSDEGEWVVMRATREQPGQARSRAGRWTET